MPDRDWTLDRMDAMDLLASLPDDSVDATITDPPYGTTANEWDKAPDWSRLLSELLRVTKGAVVIFSQMPVAADVVDAARGKFRYQIVWHKSRPCGFLDANRRPLRAHEVILAFCKKGYGEYHPQMTAGTPYISNRPGNSTTNYSAFNASSTINEGTRHPTDVIEFDSEQGGVHPTQKPLELVRWLVRTYTSEGQTVLDPYSGSGTTGEACALERRSFIGSEINAEYHAKAVERVQLAYAQGTLF